jgi:hypothetical protein
MTKHRILTIIRKCAGGCGATVEYSMEDDRSPSMPELSLPGVEYAGGHLCQDCERVVEDALKARRPRPGWSWFPFC